MLFMSLKNLFRYKMSFISIFLLTISSSIILFGSTYITSIYTLWDAVAKQNVNYRILMIEYDYDNLSEDEALNYVENLEHVSAVTKSAGYIIGYSVFSEFVSDTNNGEITIRGVSKGSLNIVEGDDLSDEENELVCALQFYPNSDETATGFNEFETVDLSGYVGKTIKVEVAGSNTEKFTIVGLYDANYDYSSGNICYATFDTIEKINLKYQSDLYEDEDSMFPIYAIVDDYNNLDSVINDLEENGYYASVVAWVKTEYGDNILRIVLILSWISAFVSLLVILIISLKRINDREKEFALCKAVGYMKKDINRNLYLESIIVSIISLILAIIISSISLYILKYHILVSNVLYSRISLNFNIISLSITILITILIPLVTTFISTKKIDEINIIDILKR